MFFGGARGTSVIQTLVAGILSQSAWGGLHLPGRPSPRFVGTWPRWPRSEPRKFDERNSGQGSLGGSFGLTGAQGTPQLA
eukprot:9799829-Alexandrium_andersonii.AAC.1